ncbi:MULTISPECIES: cytochrome c [Bordetella]|uniref:Alcohol dehydrogenase n=1 Tax=Bordetella genomosp. 7 TaxID=1416805 RepID=A0A261RRP9_9BORD|nr:MULTISPECIES: cytochrome c [Bordetella]OZI27352.1 alcohol dehydrogenase [Bordetella genomosp. 7]
MKRIIKISVLALLLACVAAIAALYWMGTRDDTSTGRPADPAEAGRQVEQGRYLARLGNCMACHTTQGGKAYAGGTAIPTRFGTLYGPNITPDPRTGIGQWSADDFWQALHNGKSKDGSLLYPAFPYTEYTRMSRADSDALYAYLRTVEPVEQPSRAHELDFPYNQRGLLAFWRALYFSPGVLEPDPGEPVPWNRGRYLVEGLGHCAACHAPRNSLGATRAQDGLSGGFIDGLDWYAPPLDNAPGTGLGHWNAQDIAQLLQTGMARQSTASGPMAEVVLGSSQFLTDEDALAIGTYLKSLPAPAIAAPAQARAAAPALLEHGGRLYQQHCAACHQDQGQGIGTAWPALAGNPTVTAPLAVNAIRMVLNGGYAPATAANPRPHGMPPFGPMLSDSDIAAVVSYIRSSWGNQAGAVTAFDVRRVRDASTRN